MEPMHWLWMAVAALAVTAGGLGMLRLYRSVNNGAEAAITGLLTLLIPVAVLVKWVDGAARDAVATGMLVGLGAVMLVGVVRLTRRSAAQRGRRDE